MQKIMVLGAGGSQLPLIKQAKEMGLYVIVLSVPGNYPGFLLADKIYYVDISDAEAVLSVAKKEQIDGICSTGTDVTLAAMGKVVDQLGLSGPGYQSGMISCNKKKMKQAFIRHNVRTARFMEIKSIAQCYEAYDELKKPIMLKVVDSAGSRGIVKVGQRQEIQRAYEYAMKETKQDYLIAEEFIGGMEFGAQGFVFEHQLKFVLPHGDWIFYGETGVPYGHYVPFALPQAVIDELTSQLEKAIPAMQLNNCAINADFILSGDEVFVLEIGARAGAACLPEMVSKYLGFNYYEQIINVAMGQAPNFSSGESQACAYELLMAAKDGVIKSIKLNDDVVMADDVSIIDLSIDYKVGEIVRKFNIGADRIGQIIVAGKEIEAVLGFLKQVKEKIEIVIE